MGRIEFMGKDPTTRIQKWKESVDNGGAFGVLMTYLSRTFDCLHRELLLGNLDVYGFHLKSMRLIPQYL